MLKSTDTLNHITDNFCKDDAEVQAIHKALTHALNTYQWQYQNASEKKYATAKPQGDKAVAKTIELLNQAGYDELAEDVAEALYNDSNILTKSKYITKAKRLMKSTAILHETINESRYKNDFAELMYQAFVEQCEKFPLKYAPAHIEGTFNDTKEQLKYEDNYSYNPYK